MLLLTRTPRLEATRGLPPRLILDRAAEQPGAELTRQGTEAFVAAVACLYHGRLNRIRYQAGRLAGAPHPPSATDPGEEGQYYR